MTTNGTPCSPQFEEQFRAQRVPESLWTRLEAKIIHEVRAKDENVRA